MRFAVLFTATCIAVSNVAARPLLDLPHVYTQLFSNLAGAVQAKDYLTYVLVNTVAG